MGIPIPQQIKNCIYKIYVDKSMLRKHFSPNFADDISHGSWVYTVGKLLLPTCLDVGANTAQRWENSTARFFSCLFEFIDWLGKCVGGQMSNSVSSPSAALKVPLSKLVSISTVTVVLISAGRSRCVNIWMSGAFPPLHSLPQAVIIKPLLFVHFLVWLNVLRWENRSRWCLCVNAGLRVC